MKYCPVCQDYALYDDDIERCPLCHHLLSPYEFNEEIEEYQDISQEYSFDMIEPEHIPFVTTSVLHNDYHGIILSLDHYQRVYPLFIKIIRTLFLNEPFQFGYFSYYTNIVLEENRYNALPENRVSLIYAGDIMGKVYVGEEVDIRTKFNKRHIRTIRSHDTNHTVRRGFSIPAGMMWIVWLLVIACIPAVLSLGMALIAELIPIICIIGCIYMFIKLF